MLVELKDRNYSISVSTAALLLLSGAVLFIGSLSLHTRREVRKKVAEQDDEIL